MVDINGQKNTEILYDKIQTVVEKTLDKKLTVNNELNLLPSNKVKVAKWLCTMDSNDQISPQSPVQQESSSVSYSPALKRSLDSDIDIEVVYKLNNLKISPLITSFY